MMLPTPFTDWEHMAQSVQKVAAPSFGGLSLRPYNYEGPVNSPIWWLVPSTSWPSHCDTKFVFRQPFAHEGCIEAGIHAEKGYTLGADDSRRTKSLIMDDRWHWHTFLKKFNNGEVLKGMRSAVRALDAPLYLRIDAYHEADRYSDRDQVIFRLDPGADGLVLDGEAKTSRGILKRPQAEDAEALPQLLAALNANGWVWVDFLITTLFTPVAEGGNWDGEKIWLDYLSHLAFAVGSTYTKGR